MTKKWAYKPIFIVEAETAEEAADKVFDLIHTQMDGPTPIEANDMELT